MKKRIVALLLVVVLLLSATSAFASSKPTASLKSASRNQTVKAGKTIKWTFNLDSGTYTKKNDAFRAKLGVIIVFKSKQVGAASWVWTGKQNYILRAKVKKDATPGKYTLKYTTYRRSTETANWSKVKTASTKFTVKK